MHYFFLEESLRFEVPEGLTAFRCVILVERIVDAADRAQISRRLVETGCLYAMAWGVDCSLWDDSIDCAAIERFDPRDIPDDKFVMTTWHSDESIGDVLFYAKFNALRSYDNRDLNQLLVLDLGRARREAEIRDIYCKA